MLRRAASLSVHRACASRPTLAMSQRSMVTVKVDDRGVGLITFNNPEKVRNASREKILVFRILVVVLACMPTNVWLAQYALP
jgi:hypothetical protein